jgi:hypothetical protein
MREAGTSMTLAEFLAQHGRVWIQLPDDAGHWYPAAVIIPRIPRAHLDREVIVTRELGLDIGHAWVAGVNVGYRWALQHDVPVHFHPYPWPFPPLEQRGGGLTPGQFGSAWNCLCGDQRACEPY